MPGSMNAASFGAEFCPVHFHPELPAAEIKRTLDAVHDGHSESGHRSRTQVALDQLSA